MAVSSAGFLGTSVFRDLDVDGSVELLFTGAIVLYGIEVDNSQNDSDVFLKLWDSAGVSVGTDAPDLVFRVEAGQKLFQPLVFADLSDLAAQGLDTGNIVEKGSTFTTGLSVACVTTGGTAGTTSPTNDVTATLITD
jgi:hypothetical protein